MTTITSPAGIRVSYDAGGSGPPLVLVHGSFSDHDSNWTLVRPFLEAHFRVHAVARRGRGDTAATRGHALEDEAEDVAAVLRAIEAPVHLLGHSYGAHCALLAALLEPSRIGTLVLYEPPWPAIVRPDALVALDTLARAGAWDPFAFAFFANTLHVPTDDLDALRASGSWPSIVADAPASHRDLRALHAYRFDPWRFRALGMPVLLQVGSGSPRDLYVTDALAAVLPDVRIDVLPGQAHEAMTTAPESYARATTSVLLSEGRLSRPTQ